MKNPVYITHYQSTLRLLAERGHQVLVGSRRKRSRDPIDKTLTASMQRLCQEHPNISLHSFPMRKDEWAALVNTSRALRAYCRYLHPRYRKAHSLRDRAAQQVTRLSGFTRLPLGPIAGWATSAAAQVVESLMPSDPVIERAIESVKPDVVVVTPLIDQGSYQPDYVRAAMRLGIPTVWCVASWDNLTNKGLVSAIPDRVLVWNEAQRDEAIELQGVPSARIVVTGA